MGVKSPQTAIANRGVTMRFREIFILVAGTTPQIITETIYALSQKNPPVYPDELYIITTSRGKRLIEDTLIKKGILKELGSEYGLPELKLKEDSFIIVKDSRDKEIDDIRDEAENEAMGNLITSFIKEKAKDPSDRLHCSLAGGRKTMSFYIGSALQLFGRPWDKLYHVLVTPEFESNPEFFYKPKKDKTIKYTLRDGTIKQLNTKDAEIHLAELPFIRLSQKLSLQGKGFKELVAEGQKEIDTATMQPELKVSLADRTVHIGDRIIEMIPVQLMLYTALLRQKTDHCKYPDREYCLECTDCFQMLVDLSSRPALNEMAKDYGKIYRGQPLKAEELIKKGWNEGNEGLPDIIRQNISKIKGAIKEQLNDETLLPYYTITTIKKYASSRYGVRVEKGKIRIE